MEFLLIIPLCLFVVLWLVLIGDSFMPKKIAERPMDHLRVYHEECGTWSSPTKIAISNSMAKGIRYNTFEAICPRCEVYFSIKVERS